MSKPKITLIDGYGFVFRAFHSLPPLTRNDGTPVGAVYGFTNMLIKLLANLHASHIAMVFDSGSKTFRNEIYSDYKANRPPCPEELIPQFPLVREAAEALNLPILEKVGFEADDLIATVAKQAAAKGFEVVIVSSDKDLMQLVDENISMFDAMKNRVISEKEVEEKFFVKPNQVLDILSLMGDSSDNVPGVRGIGPKTAAELINKYQTLENLLENLDEIKQDKRRQMLKDGVENAKLSKKLIALCETVPVSDNLDDYLLRSIDGQKLMSFLNEQNFKALAGKVQKDFGIDGDVVNNATNQNSPTPKQTKPNQEIKITKTIVNQISQIQNLNQQAIQNGNLIVDFVFEKNEVQSVILSSVKESSLTQEIFLIDIINEAQNLDAGDLFAPKAAESQSKNGLKLEDLMVEIAPILLDESVAKIGYQVKDLIKFASLAWCPSGTFVIDDISLMAYVLNSGTDKTDFDVLVAENLSDETPENFSANCQTLEKGKIPEEFANENARWAFYCFKNYATYKIYQNLKQQIFDQKLNNVYYSFERPLIKVLSKMEAAGIAVNNIKLKELSIHFEEEIQQLTKEIHKLAGEEFNIGSPKQLGHILFEKLSLEAGKKSKKTGALSTGQEVLEELDLAGHDIAGKILKWRAFSKLKSTYSDALQNAINEKTGRIHTTFSNTSTSTGRLSSNHPNLQNIPIRSEEGRKIRSAFVAKKGHQLICADYSQIELRVLAAFANIEALKEAFLADKDIHNITAAQIFGVEENEVDKEMRRKSKAINFGIIYGISAFGLAKQLKIAREDAAAYIKSYFETYPGIQNYMHETQEFAKENGFVKTITGRKCFVTNINNKNPILRGIAERLAINAPIQGSAADIIKKAMIDFDEELGKSNLKSQMILQVHDELVIEAPDSEVAEVSKLLQNTMQNAFVLDVPLKVDLTVSESWK